MQTTKLKTYAPKARRDFIAAVTRRAASFGLSAKGISTVREEGEVVVIEGQPYPKRVGAQRARHLPGSGPYKTATLDTMTAMHLSMRPQFMERSRAGTHSRSRQAHRQRGIKSRAIAGAPKTGP